ncbi:MAG: RagB/SusD family nutrient uptake outer membrane protein [Candidatus Symbiothrix sp.]|nr:RagB/SusD family nutrient uptake outer membrane protein [Candidatus Symbiothrix sp.]
MKILAKKKDFKDLKVLKYLKYLKYLKIFIFLIIFSCQDFLDPEPDGSLTEKEVFSDPLRARGFLNNIYTYIPGGFYGIDGSMQACITDEAKSVKLTGGAVTMTDGSMSSRNFDESWTWSHYYTGIRKSTVFLENVDEAVFVTSQQQALNPGLNLAYQAQYKGEAEFLKGLFYFELIKRFGGAPLIPGERLLLSDDLAGYPRNTYDECVQYILECCDKAAGLLPNSWVGNVDEIMLGRASKGSAYALKSRALLYAASELNNPSGDVEKWKAAAVASKAVLDMPEYGLLDGKTKDWNESLQIWTQPYNKEVLFATAAGLNNDIEKGEFPRGLTFYDAQGGEGRTHPTHTLVKAFQMADGSDGSWAENGGAGTAKSLYANRDPRLGYWIYYNGIRQHARTANPVETGMDANGVPYTSGLNKDATYTHTGYYLRKFVNTSANIQSGADQRYKFWVIFRYAEILLNYAEAMNEAYGPTGKPDGYTLSALDALNAVRTRVDMPVYEKNKPVDQAAVREGIRHERQIELCFEEHRYWDLKRWKTAVEALNGPVLGIEITGSGSRVESWREFVVEKRVFTDKMYLYPIPYSELLKTNMEQNPGWEAPAGK